MNGLTLVGTEQQPMLGAGGEHTAVVETKVEQG